MSLYQRQQLEKTLPKASEPCVRHVNQVCIQAGVQINAPDYAIIHRAFIDYLLNTAEGKTTMLKILGAEVTPATYEKQYYPEGYFGMDTHRLEHTKLVEYMGWIYQGKSVAHNRVEVREQPNLLECEGCHGKFPKSYCAILVKTYHTGRERVEQFCNHCRMNNDDIRIRGEASGKTCSTCTYKSCPYHPTRLTDQRFGPNVPALTDQRSITPAENIRSPGNFSAI